MNKCCDIHYVCDMMNHIAKITLNSTEQELSELVQMIYDAKFKSEGEEKESC